MQIDETTKADINALINEYQGGDEKNIETLNTLLSNIQSRLSDVRESSENTIYASYTTKEQRLVIILTEYDSNGTVVDLRRIYIGEIIWEDDFDPPTITLRWDDRVSTDKKVYATSIRYGNTISTIPTDVPTPENYRWMRVLAIDNQDQVTDWGDPAIGTLVKESMLFRLQNAQG